MCKRCVGLNHIIACFVYVQLKCEEHIVIENILADGRIYDLAKLIEIAWKCVKSRQDESLIRNRLDK